MSELDVLALRLDGKSERLDGVLEHRLGRVQATREIKEKDAAQRGRTKGGSVISIAQAEDAEDADPVG